MAHYALLNSENIVIQVFVGRDEDDLVEGISDWESYYAPAGCTVKRTSYNTHGGIHKLGGTAFRKNYAGLGYTYDPERDAFISPKPLASWILDEDSCQWEAPVAYPNDGQLYTWNEANQDWVLAE
jgi:hypothetical protein